ncbi:MAG: PLP-dependent aminotransferase family protein [Acidobacteria bacterium]|nr:PLP-dependent aminotransferase family protein [Acidobacteriota bacterium]
MELPAIVLSHDSGEPLYRQLYGSIKVGIFDGQIPDGMRLPATRELAVTLGVNRATVAQAYELLEREGLLRAHVGRGSFIQSPAPVAETVISFASSRPSDDLFPLDAVARILQDSTRDAALMRTLLQLGSTLGYQPLRQYILDHHLSLTGGLPGEATRGEQRERGEVLITSGCQQALDLVARAFVQAGDLVMMEDPVYPGLREVFHRSGGRLIGLPVSDIGLDLDALELALRRERPRLLLVTPDFQNPTGATLPLDARRALMALTRQNGVMLVEIGIYRGLRYEGDTIPSLRALDETGEVVHIGSFSKIAFPGLRVGWVCAGHEAVERLVEAKQWCDLHTDHLSQYILHEFARSGGLAAHRERVLEAGRVRLQAAVEALEALPEVAQFTRPQGGMSLWATLRAGIDAERVQDAVAGRVSFLPGSAFAVSRRHPNSFRLSFAGVRPAAIQQGIEWIGEGARRAAAPAPDRYGSPHMAIV